MAGRLPHFLQAWRSIITDQWVLEIISNRYTLPLFMAPPPLKPEPLETPLPTVPQRREALWTEVQSLLDKGAVEEIHLGKEGGGGITPFTSPRLRKQAAFVLS